MRVSDGTLPGLYFENPFNETELPQEAQTQTTITWPSVPLSSEYVVSWSPVTELDEQSFQVRMKLFFMYKICIHIFISFFSVTHEISN